MPKTAAVITAQYINVMIITKMVTPMEHLSVLTHSRESNDRV